MLSYLTAVFDIILTITDFGLLIKLCIKELAVEKWGENGQKRGIYAQNLWITLWKLWIFGWKAC